MTVPMRRPWFPRFTMRHGHHEYDLGHGDGQAAVAPDATPMVMPRRGQARHHADDHDDHCDGTPVHHDERSRGRQPTTKVRKGLFSRLAAAAVTRLSAMII